MRTFLITLAAIFSFNIHAAAVHNKVTLPAAVRTEILKEITAIYPTVYDLKEVKTEVTALHVDQNIYDYIYETRFTGKSLQKGQSSETASFMVKTVDASQSISNPVFKSIYIESLKVQSQKPLCLGTAQPCDSPNDICCSDGQFCGISLFCR